jgi:murein DD-endopeptidase MepM/ murein hydrolase activator NlpD
MHLSRRAPRAGAAVLAVCALLGVASAATAAPAAIDDKRAQLAALQERLAEVDARAGEAAAAHNRALDRRDALRARIRTTRIRAERTARQLTASRDDLSRRLVRLYVSESPAPLEVVLSSGSLTEAVETLDVLERAAVADATVVRTLRERRAELARLRVRLADDAEAAARELAEVDGRRRELEAILAERRAEVERAESELGALLEAERRRQARLAAERRAAVKAQREAQRLIRVANEDSAPSAQGDLRPGTAAAPGSLPAGSHVFPLAGPSHFSDDWLYSRPGGRYHEGIDLFADRGTPVVAVAGGTLFRVGYSGISGNRLWLRDDAGTEFFYAHLDSFSSAAREGARVEKGTVIGYNGDTGDARGTSPHVHFEIHPGGGGPIRPYPIVSAWPRIG